MSKQSASKSMEKFEKTITTLIHEQEVSKLKEFLEESRASGINTQEALNEISISSVEIGSKQDGYIYPILLHYCLKPCHNINDTIKLLEIAKILIEYGANPLQKDQEDQRYQLGKDLHHIKGKNFYDYLEASPERNILYLIINEDPDGLSEFLEKTRESHSELLKKSHHLQINGQYPILHYCLGRSYDQKSFKSQTQITEKLLEFGVDLSRQIDYQGRTYH